MEVNPGGNIFNDAANLLVSLISRLLHKITHREQLFVKAYDLFRF